MFFFIGGITPKVRKLDELPRVCLRCGHHSFFRIRIDHYLNLFFIPLFPVKKGKPFFSCENCGLESISETQDKPYDFTRQNELCPDCGARLEKDFSFCPYCGRSLN